MRLKHAATANGMPHASPQGRGTRHCCLPRLTWSLAWIARRKRARQVGMTSLALCCAGSGAVCIVDRNCRHVAPRHGTCRCQMQRAFARSAQLALTRPRAADCATRDAGRRHGRSTRKCRTSAGLPPKRGRGNLSWHAVVFGPECLRLPAVFPSGRLEHSDGAAGNCSFT